MRATVHSKIKETPFERHYGKKQRPELISYLNLPSDVMSAKPETLQVYSFASLAEQRRGLRLIGNENTPQSEV